MPSSTWQHGSVTTQHCARTCRTARDGTYIANGVAVVVSRRVVAHFGALLLRHLLHLPTHQGEACFFFKFDSRRNKKSPRRGTFSHLHTAMLMHVIPLRAMFDSAGCTPLSPPWRCLLPAVGPSALRVAVACVACEGSVCAELLRQGRCARCLAGTRRPGGSKRRRAGLAWASARRCSGGGVQGAWRRVHPRDPKPAPGAPRGDIRRLQRPCVNLCVCVCVCVCVCDRRLGV